VNGNLSSWSSPSWLGLYHALSLREFDLEFRTLANNIVSLFTYKRVQGVGSETNLFSLSLGSSKGQALCTSHVVKEYLGMKGLRDKNPLKR